jgi:hypothetical protein
MPRLYKFAIFGFLAYAVVTATPDQQAEMGRGLLAIKNAAVEACTRDGSLCSQALSYAAATISGAMSNDPAPWMDEQSKRVQPPASPPRPQSPGTS